MRYGTMPIVNNTGGLKDTVVDLALPEGYGIKFNTASIKDSTEAINRAIVLYADDVLMKKMQKRMMSLNFSWDKSAAQYLDLYKSLIK